MHDITQRLWYIALAVIAVFLIITSRLFYLQILQNDFFFTRGQRNYLRYETINPPRGNITDQRGALLATNRPITTLYWQGTGKSSWDQQQCALLTLLSSWLNKNLLEDPDLLYAERKGKQTFLLIPELSFDQLSCLAEQFSHNPNVVLETNYKRFYPHDSVACHLLGHLQGMQQEVGSGKMGLEKILEDMLCGTPGTLLTTINSTGKRLSSQEIRQALAGKDIATTLDLDIQLIAEKIFPEDHAGAILIMNPQTGAIETMLSRPSFDPNMFLRPISTEEWLNIQDKRPFLNRVFNLYPPASPIKLITTTMVLENKLIDPEVHWHCAGCIEFYGRKYHCSNKLGHGPLNLKDALAKSCNIPFFEIAKRVKIDSLAHYAAKFGLGQSTNSLFPEKVGLVPTASWKRQTFGERWYPGETLSAVIGQGYWLVSPLQMARMIAAICEGYLVKPRILQDEAEEYMPLMISQETRKFIKEAMSLVVQKGSGQSLKALLKNMQIYAKTGTAQVSSLEKREVANEFLEHGYFVAYIQYKHYKPFVIVIIVEHVGSSRVAASVAKQFVREYCLFMDTQETQEEILDEVEEFVSEL